MVNKKLTTRQQRLEEFLQAVEAAQKLQDDILKYGLDAAYLYVEDVDGDWLEKWGEDEEQKIADSITVFLESGDWVAIRIRKQLEDKSLPELAVRLEKCLSISEPHERLFEIKKVLADGMANRESNLDASNEYSEFELLDLAEELLEKLIEMSGNGVDTTSQWDYSSN